MTYADHVRSTHVHLELRELLGSPVSILLGVSDAAETALAEIGIRSVFDLGASWLFANARAATKAAATGTLTSRFGVVQSDLLQPGVSYESIEDLGELSVEQLRGVTAVAAASLKQALNLETIRELALWAPQQAARRMVGDATGSTTDPDELQTEKLRPRFGEYPTERVYYSTLVMLQMQFDGERTPLAGPVSLKSALSGNGLTRPAIGALLTISQSWYAQGITLGHLLHSLALAPGEATRIAVIDWSRRTRAAVTESTSETEQLANATEHARAVSEVQNATASEVQRGGSMSSSQSSSESSSGQASVGTGLLTSLWASGDVSGTTESASTQATSQSSSWSLGNRSVTASMAQSVNDRTEQHASSARNRRASAVREVSQSEHEEVSTRIVANYNHMHALTVQYYEVVQVYRIATQVHRAERCLFVPVMPIDFAAGDAMEYVDRFRGALIAGALTRRARELLLDTSTAVALKPATAVRVASFRPELFKSLVSASAMKSVSAHALAKNIPDEAAGPKLVTSAMPSVAVTTRTWDTAAVALASRYVARPLLRTGSDALHFPDDTDLLGLTFSGIAVKRIQLDRFGAAAVDDTFDVSGDSARLDLPKPVRLAELARIFVAKSGDTAASGSMTLECSYLGRHFSTPPIPIELGSGTVLQSVLSLTTDEEDRKRELLAHLRANQTHYSQVVFRALDSAMIVSLLSPFDWNGRPLADQVEPRPLAIAGNYLVLRAPIDSGEDSGIARTSDDRHRNGNMSWEELLRSRGIDFKETDQRLVPIPTTGVFAEAVLGRSNSAEKLDLTRFWNWQDSPIPMQPTEIAPISTGSRATSEDLRTANLGQPVLNIVNPTSLPAPTGVGAVLDAVSNGNMFRDMSGLAGTQGLTRAAMEGTLQAATDAAQIASANMRTQAQKSVAMGQIAADIVKSLVGGGGSGSTQGISGEGARINHARSMDERGVPTSTGSSGGSVNAMPGADSGGGGEASAAGDGVGDAGGGGSSGSDTAASTFSHEGSYFTRAGHGLDPAIASATTSATKPLLAFAVDAGALDAAAQGSSPGGQKTLPPVTAPSPVAFPSVSNMPGPSQHPSLMTMCPTGQFFGDPPTRNQSTSGAVLSPAEALQRQNDIIKAIAAAKPQRPLSAANLQHWLDGTGQPLVMSNAEFKKVESEVPTFLATKARERFEVGCRDRLKNASHSQGTLRPPSLTPGTKGPVRFMQFRDGVRPSASANSLSADLFTALGSYNVHCAVWVQATFIKHEGSFLGIGGHDVFEVDILHWCVQIYDVYDWNAGGFTPFGIPDAEVLKLPLPPGAVNVRSVGAGMSIVTLKDTYFRDLEVSGIGRAYLVRTEPFDAPSSVMSKFAINV